MHPRKYILDPTLKVFEPPEKMDPSSLWYLYYYLHRSGDLVSPVLGTFCIVTSQVFHTMDLYDLGGNVFNSEFATSVLIFTIYKEHCSHFKKKSRQ